MFSEITKYATEHPFKAFMGAGLILALLAL
jgi:hypothetical protein